MKPVKLGAERRYIPLCDRDLTKGKQSVIVITDLTLEEHALLTDSLGQVRQNGDFAVNLGSQGILAWDLGVAGVDNFQDEDGNAIVLKRDETKRYISNTKKKPWKRDILGRIPRDVIAEVSNIVLNGGELTEEEKKN